MYTLPNQQCHHHHVYVDSMYKLTWICLDKWTTTIPTQNLKMHHYQNTHGFCLLYSRV
eukprot:UN05914